jgi:hypothetical protein
MTDIKALLELFPLIDVSYIRQYYKEFGEIFLIAKSHLEKNKDELVEETRRCKDRSTLYTEF